MCHLKISVVTYSMWTVNLLVWNLLGISVETCQTLCIRAQRFSKLCEGVLSFGFVLCPSGFDCCCVTRCPFYNVKNAITCGFNLKTDYNDVIKKTVFKNRWRRIIRCIFLYTYFEVDTLAAFSVHASLTMITESAWYNYKWWSHTKKRISY